MDQELPYTSFNDFNILYHNWILPMVERNGKKIPE
jgi:hypothetical protein